MPLLLLMKPIRIAIVGIGNCASAFLQGLEYYQRPSPEQRGLLHASIGRYTPADIRVVAAFDVDARKVGKPLKEAFGSTTRQANVPRFKSSRSSSPFTWMSVW